MALKEDIIFIVSFILFSLAIGLIIYRLIAGFDWIDSFYNASMILSSAGPVSVLTTVRAKVAASLYTLYSGGFFLIILAILISRYFSNANHPIVQTTNPDELSRRVEASN